MRDNIPEEIQSAVDQYVELYQVSKQLEDRMKELKVSILTFMNENGVDDIMDRQGRGKVQLSVTERATLTSRYTTYDMDVVANMLDSAVLERCVVSVVDKEKLEALSQLGEVDSAILSHKSTKPTQALSVKLKKS